jgi:uncharacterized YigZ family protein
MYTIPAVENRTEETIQRSRFIASVAHAPTEEEAKIFIARIKDEFPNATHHCWAYVAGPPGDTARIGMSDDGEPHGTAGKPILTVLLYSEIGEIVAVVTRYFGGIKLGTGGLVRAYSGGVKNALAGLAVTEKRDIVTLNVIVDYSKINIVKQMFESYQAEIIHEEYGTDVSFQVEISKNDEPCLVKALTDLTGGDVVLLPL